MIATSSTDQLAQTWPVDVTLQLLPNQDEQPSKSSDRASSSSSQGARRVIGTTTTTATTHTPDRYQLWLRQHEGD